MPGSEGAVVIGLRCVACGRTHAEADAPYTCPSCGDNLDVLYDYDSVKARWSRERTARAWGSGIWRWLPFLPVGSVPAISLRIGDTPLVPLPRLAASLGLSALHVKDDGRNPSASLKDRASAIAVARALERGVGRITCASTGNAASSLATIAASVGLESIIFVPETIPRPKLAQLLLHGARVALVRGNYDTAYDLCLQATARFGWSSRNTGFNPYLCEGKKTVGFEIMEESAWIAPERVFVSVGDGCILAGVHK